MVRKAVFALALGMCALLSFAESDKGGLISGDGWALLVSAPAGWIWDSVTLRPQGILGLFYKAGASYSPSKLHIYISPTAKSRRMGPPPWPSSWTRTKPPSCPSDAGLLVKDTCAPYSPGPGLPFRHEGIRRFGERLLPRRSHSTRAKRPSSSSCSPAARPTSGTWNAVPCSSSWILSLIYARSDR
jgi:hypothetical protein